MESDQSFDENSHNSPELLWKIISDYVECGIGASLPPIKKKLHVNDGITLNRTICLTEKIIGVVYLYQRRIYAVFTSKFCHLFNSQTYTLDSIHSVPKSFHKIEYHEKQNKYVAIQNCRKYVWLLRDNFAICNKTNLKERTIDFKINAPINQVIVLGEEGLHMFAFRYKGCYLIKTHVIRAGFGINKTFCRLVLEEIVSVNQKLFVIYGSNVNTYNVWDKSLKYEMTEIHGSEITSMKYIDCFSLIVTAAKDGCIKIWTESWKLNLVFVGHSSKVTSISQHPFEPHIISASNDSTIRVWSYQESDEVKRINTNCRNMTIHAIRNNSKFMTFGDNKCDFWEIENVHSLHTYIGTEIKTIKNTDHPKFPIRTVMIGRDSSIRIGNVKNGSIISSLLVKEYSVIDAAYSISEGIIFVVLDSGDIYKYDIMSNPAKLVNKWKCPDKKKACNYLLVYEYVVVELKSTSLWSGMKRAVTVKGYDQTKTDESESETGQESKNKIKKNSKKKTENETKAEKYLLLGGRKDGHICVFDWTTGKVVFAIEAHGTKGVLSMMANSKSDQLISAGLDNIIKVWRLYPYAEESLSPMTAFYCSHTPLYMSILRERLIVAIKHPPSARYTICMYTLDTKDRINHSISDDHTEMITGLSACSKLRIFASAAKDYTVRIWNENNELIRIINLENYPKSISFCNNSGDLLIGYKKNLHKIHYMKYLPQNYIKKLNCMIKDEDINDNNIEFNSILAADYYNSNDIKILQKSKAAYQFKNFKDKIIDGIKLEDRKVILKEENDRQEAFLKIDLRNEELQKIIKGLIKRKKHSLILSKQQKQEIKNEAFENYFKSLFDLPGKVVLKDEKEVETKSITIVHSMHDVCKLLVKHKKNDDSCSDGFFPKSKKMKFNLMNVFVPNSTFTRKFMDKEAIIPKAIDNIEEYVPPKVPTPPIDEDGCIELSVIEKMRANSKASFLEKTRKAILNRKFEQEQKELEESVKKKSVSELSSESSTMRDIYNSNQDKNTIADKINQIVDKSQSMLMSEINIEIEVPEEKIAIKPVLRKKMTMSRSKSIKVVKFVANATIAATDHKMNQKLEILQKVKDISSLAEIPEIESKIEMFNKPNIELPQLPETFVKLLSQTWFRDIFPFITINTIIPPYKDSILIDYIKKCLEDCQIKFKIEIIDFIIYLNQVKFDISLLYDDLYNQIYNTKSIQLLNKFPALMESWALFLKKYIDVLKIRNEFDKRFYTIILSLYIGYDSKLIRNTCMDVLLKCGISPQNKKILSKLLKSWNPVHENEKFDFNFLKMQENLNEWLELNLSNLINFINDDSRDDDNPLKSFIDENLYIYKDKYFKYGEKYEKSDFEHDFNFMDVINFFCDLKRIKQDYYQLKQKEMLVKIKTHAKQQNVVHRNLIYKGITHKSVCHADRETRFLTMGNRPLKTNKDYLYFGGNTKIPLSLNFNLPKINLQNSLKLLQNENIPKNDIIAPSKDLSTTFSSTYFIIERSHIQNI